MSLLIGLHALKDEVIARMPLRIIGGGWALDGGGNSRGTNAVDLQIARDADTQVASGIGSVLFGGINNTASGYYTAVIGGKNNTASDYYNAIFGGRNNVSSGGASTVVGGGYNTANGSNSHVFGGWYNTASGDYSVIVGGFNNATNGVFSGIIGGTEAKADKRAQISHAAGKFSVVGDAQYSHLTSKCKTTNNTPEELFLDGDGGSARCTIASDTTWSFHILVVARRTDADNESAAYDFIGCIDNNAGTTALVESVIKTVVAEDTAGWDCNVTADNTNDALIITATGENAKTIQWVAFIQLVETTG